MIRLYRVVEGYCNRGLLCFGGERSVKVGGGGVVIEAIE